MRKLTINDCMKLAVEYDGRQHFMPVDYFGGEEEFIKTIKRDKLKDNLIYKNKDILYFMRISYKEDLSIHNIEQKLAEAGVKC